MDISKILENTPFKHPNNIYKDNTIPILKDYNISDQCKEIGKQLLNSTKNPTCQHVDVLIPNSDRANFHKLEHFKSFFGKKFDEPKMETKQSQPEEYNKVNNIKKAKGPNACLVETPITKPINEFITVTENFVEQLEAVVTKVMKPIRESIIDPSKQPILDQYSFNRIFINMEDILQVNQAFLISLKQYQHGTTSDSFGTILSRHVETLDCYKIFLLGKANSQTCHQQNLNKNKNYAKFLLTISLPKNYGVNDVLSNPVQQMARYDLMISNILKHMDIHDSDIELLKQVISKVACISDMRYGSDSSLLNLYHLIREAPASLIKSRKLLGYYDASELSISTGKTHRPVTLLIFTDKIMVVKRKNYSLQSKDFLEKIEEKIKIGSSSNLIQKAKEVYNGLPFEFKGWVDIQSTEFFHGLKDRPDTFFLRTCLQELDPNATEKETETYFRKSDRLYSVIPNTLNKNLSTFIARKQELMNLCQKQSALLKVVESSELFHQDKFKLSTWTHIYNETSYKQQQNKNNILIVYVEQTMPKLEFLNNDENVWVVMLLTHHEGGYKLTIRSRINLIPIRELSREIEYESIIPHGDHSTGMRKDANSPLDFIDTLWNNVFFYERRLRATEAYSGINDDLLRDRARSRSRSKSLTRVASNMSIGKLFARSRDNSPSRRRSSSISSSNNDRTTDDDDFDYEEAEKPASHVPDPIFKVATINKHTGSEFRDLDATTAAYNAPTTKRPIRTQPRYVAPNEILVRDDHAFTMDPFPPQDHLQDRYQHREYSTSFDVMLFSSSDSSSPEPLSSSRSSSRNGSGSGSFSDADRLLLSRGVPGDAATTYSGSSTSNSIRSYFDENHFFPGSVRNNAFDESHFSSPSTSTSRLQQRNRSYDERLMNTIDNSVRRTPSATRTRAPLHPNLYHTTTPNQQPPQHRAHTMPDMMSHNFNQLKNDVNGLIDELIYSQQQLRSQQDINRYYNNAYEHVQGLRTHIVSRLDSLMENLHQSTNQLR